jgi:hypothetical protein
MRRVGDDGNLAVIRVDETIHNDGSVRAQFLGHSLTVFASLVVALKARVPATSKSYSNVLAACYANSKEEPVFCSAFVTQVGDPSTPHVARPALGALLWSGADGYGRQSLWTMKTLRNCLGCFAASRIIPEPNRDVFIAGAN